MAGKGSSGGGSTPAGKALVLKPSTAKRLAELLEQPELVPDPNHFNIAARQGKRFFSLRDFNPRANGGPVPGGRFRPYIGGSGADQLFVSPGTITYVPIANEGREDVDDQPQPQQVVPLYPKINGTGIDEEDPPSFDVSGRSSAAVWLQALRLKCGSSLPTEDDEPEKLVITNRGAKPAEVEGSIHRLLFECDFEASGGGAKAIINLDQMIASDVDVPFMCEEVEVSVESTSAFDSDDLDSSDLKDDSPDGSDPSGDSTECDNWNVLAQWVARQSCYERYPKTGSVIIYIEVAIDLGKMFSKCRNWFAYISAPGGQPKATPAEAGMEPIGSEFKVALGKRKNTGIQCRFFFTPTPCKTDQKVVVRLRSEQKEKVNPEDEDEPCCEGAAGSKTVSIGPWPAWCGYNGKCSNTTVLAPP